MLSLDDNRWKELSHRGWADGKRYELDPDAPYVPDELKLLFENPLDYDRLGTLCAYLASEGTIWEAAFAAFPYLVQIASRLSPKQRTEYLIYLGFMVTDVTPSDGFDIDPYIAESYRESLAQALCLSAETILEEHTESETRYLLGTIASLKGHTKIGEILENLDSYSFCHECDEIFFELDD